MKRPLTTTVASMAAALAVAIELAPGAARSEPLPTPHYTPLTVAIAAALAALKECTDKGHHISVEVMNHNAMVLITLHHELATIHSAYSAHAKAYTVLSYSYSSGETTSAAIAQRLMRNPGDVARIQGIPGLIL